jgi:hypothetical protein
LSGDNVYVMNADGSSQRQVAHNATNPAWQPAPVRRP